MKGEISMIGTVLQISYYQGSDGTTSGNNVLKLSDYSLGPSDVTMQAMLAGVFSGDAPVSATAYVDYYVANGQIVTPGPTPTVYATGVTEIGLRVDLQGGNAVVGALLVFVSA
jgi:hypothetical protein